MNPKLLALALLALLALPACAADATETGGPPPRENVQTTQQAVEGGALGTSFHIDRAVRISGGGGQCSATRIGPNHVITALHCGVAVGDAVRFYSSGTPYPQPSDASRTVEAVGRRPGTWWNAALQTGDLVDENGIFADFVILRLAGLPVRGLDVAKMAWLYPGDDAFGDKAGNGTHEGNQSLVGILMHKYDTTWTSDDSDGPFRTSEDALNPGDSGGAFYYQYKLLGVASSHDWLSGVWRARYTSVARHLNWILDVINYAWSGWAPVSGRLLGGAVSSTFFGKSHLVCQYACDNTSTCAGYNYFSAPNQCNLLSSVTSAVNGVSGTTSGIR